MNNNRPKIDGNDHSERIRLWELVMSIESQRRAPHLSERPQGTRQLSRLLDEAIKNLNGCRR